MGRCDVKRLQHETRAPAFTQRLSELRQAFILGGSGGLVSRLISTLKWTQIGVMVLKSPQKNQLLSPPTLQVVIQSFRDCHNPAITQPQYATLTMKKIVKSVAMHLGRSLYAIKPHMTAKAASPKPYLRDSSLLFAARREWREQRPSCEMRAS